MRSPSGFMHGQIFRAPQWKAPQTPVGYCMDMQASLAIQFSLICPLFRYLQNRSATLAASSHGTDKNARSIAP